MDSTALLELRSFVPQEADAEPRFEAPPPESPFLSLYGMAQGEAVADPRQSDFALFFSELHDVAFEAALARLAHEAGARYDDWLGEQGETMDDARAERMLEQHFAPLVAEAHRMLDSVAAELRQRDVQVISEADVDEIVDRYRPEGAMEPAFEEFFGKLKKMVKKVAGKAASLAKKGIGLATKLGLGPVLAKLKPLIKPLLKRVIKVAIGKLPASLQPLARKLAADLPMLKELDDEDGAAQLDHFAGIQLEFNAHVARMLYARDESAMDMEVADAAAVERERTGNVYADLDQARERFVQRLRELRQGEDPEPLVQEFIPAILPALKLGISIAGRKNVVGFLAKLIAPLIKGVVGPPLAPQLSQAIVDVGLRLMQLEAGADDEGQFAAHAAAATIEDTVRLVSEMSAAELDDNERFEAGAVKALERSAATNLPPILQDPVYRRRPELAEGRRLRGVWVMMPGGRRKRFKKFSRAVPARLAPHKVAAVESFGGGTLGEALEETYGIARGEDVDTVVHLYEAIPGGRLDEAPGDLHPLTRDAAFALLGEADLGRDESLDADPYAASPGQRFYSLEVAGRRPLASPTAAGGTARRRRSEVRVGLDFQRGTAWIRFFLSEVRAQELAVKMRQNGHVGLMAAQIAPILERGLRSALTGQSGRLKILHDAVPPHRVRAALQRVPGFIRDRMLALLREWSIKRLVKELKEGTAGYLKATEDAADGMTIAIRIQDPPGFPQLRAAFSGKGISLTDLRLSGDAPKVDVKFHAGYVDA